MQTHHCFASTDQNPWATDCTTERSRNKSRPYVRGIRMREGWKSIQGRNYQSPWVRGKMKREITRLYWADVPRLILSIHFSLTAVMQSSIPQEWQSHKPPWRTSMCVYLCKNNSDMKSMKAKAETASGQNKLRRQLFVLHVIVNASSHGCNFQCVCDGSAQKCLPCHGNKKLQPFLLAVKIISVSNHLTLR